MAVPPFPGFGGANPLREFKEAHASGSDGSRGEKFPAFDAGAVVQEKSTARPATKESGVVKPGRG